MLLPCPEHSPNPSPSDKLGYLLKEKNINIVEDFNIEQVDPINKKIIDYGGLEVDYDLLVTVPTNMGDASMERSGLGDDLNFVPTDPHTLQSKAFENIFVVGDATNLPTSKAGSVAHFEAEILTDNILRYIKGQPLEKAFDGHANCFVETGKGKALLIDFNYTQEPVPGTFPIPGTGPPATLKGKPNEPSGENGFQMGLLEHVAKSSQDTFCLFSNVNCWKATL